MMLRFCSFDICEDTGGAAAFFPSGHGALLGTFTEVSCGQWSGSDGGVLWTGACLSGETAVRFIHYYCYSFLRCCIAKLAVYGLR